SQGNLLTGRAGQLAAGFRGASPVGVNLVSTFTEVQGQPGVYTTTLTGVKAQDVTLLVKYNGNRLGDLSTKVTLKAGEVSGTNANTEYKLGNNVTTLVSGVSETLVYKPLDAHDNAVTNLGSSLKFVATPPDGVTIGSTSEANGTYTATVTGNKAHASVTIVPEVDSVPMGTPANVDIAVVPGAPAVSGSALSTLSSTAAKISTDNGASATLELHLKDAQGNIIPGSQSSIVADVNNSGGTAATGVNPVTFTESTATPGEYTATLSGTKAQLLSIGVKFNGTLIQNLTTQVELETGAPDGSSANSTFTVSKASMTTDESANTITLVLSDTNGNAGDYTVGASGVGISLSPTTGASISNLAQTQTKGTYTGILKAIKPGNYTLTPTYSGTAISGLAAQTVTVSVGAIASSSPLQLGASGTSQSIKAGDKVNIMLTAKDAAGNAVTGLAPATGTPALTFESDSPGVTVGRAAEGNPGVYTASITGKTVGTYTLTAKHSGTTVGSGTASLTVTTAASPVGGNGQGGQANDYTTFTSSTNDVVVSDATAPQKVTYTVILKDGHGNLMKGEASNLSLKPTVGNMTVMVVSSLTETSANSGTYTATIYGKKAQGVTMQLMYKDVAVQNLDAVTVNFKPGDPDTTHSTIPAAIAMTQGDPAAKVTWVLKDKWDNAVDVSTASVTTNTSTDVDVLALSAVTPAANGEFSVEVTPMKALGTPNTLVPALASSGPGAALTGFSVRVTVTHPTRYPTTAHPYATLEEAEAACAAHGGLPTIDDYSTAVVAGTMVRWNGPDGSVQPDYSSDVVGLKWKLLWTSQNRGSGERITATARSHTVISKNEQLSATPGWRANDRVPYFCRDEI
ncbi:invasin domain 3-containing protein, partial [Enterobacter asburiae]|uniref:invasin domain 3-containing protein n=1 Tax=Enterobacter asburiae TaxID=61645 RepID=UPI003F5763FC